LIVEALSGGAHLKRAEWRQLVNLPPVGPMRRDGRSGRLPGIGLTGKPTTGVLA
jgi:hypothetical protein